MNKKKYNQNGCSESKRTPALHQANTNYKSSLSCGMDSGDLLDVGLFVSKLKADMLVFKFGKSYNNYSYKTPQQVF